MQNISYSEARNNLKSLCDEVRESHEPALITRKGGDVVLIGAEDWEAINETLAVTDIRGAVERITSASDYQALESNDKEELEALL
ncbi:MAG: hypothetical protein COB41_01375 [Proteobacteria bacterium]|nr:MAG: hypothetical protein COB41_01375 [Pseudomonadota bacterium]